MSRSPAPPRAPSPVLAAAGSVWPLLLGMGLLMLGNGLQGTLLGVRATSEGFTTAVTGLVMSGYFVGFLAGSMLTPGYVARVGHLRVFAAFASIASVAILVHSVWVAPLVWGLVRVFTGFAFAGIYIVTESWLNDRVTNEHRGGLISVYMIVSYLGMGGGQLLLNIADPNLHELFILVSVLVSLAAVPILLTVTRQPEQHPPEPLSWKSLFGLSRLATVGSFAIGLAQGALFGMGAVYGRNLGLTVVEVSLFMAALIAGGALLQWPVGKLSDRVDRRRVIAWMAFGGAVSAFVALIVQQTSVTALIVVAGLLGGSALTLYSLFQAHTNDRLQAHQRVNASSGLILAFGLGAILGPTIAGWLMSAAGPSGLLWLVCGVHLAIGVYTLQRRRRGAPLDVTEQTSYVAVPARTPALSPALAERVEEHAGDAVAADPAPARAPGTDDTDER